MAGGSSVYYSEVHITCENVFESGSNRRGSGERLGKSWEGSRRGFSGAEVRTASLRNVFKEGGPRSRRISARYSVSGHFCAVRHMRYPVASHAVPCQSD